MTDVGLWSPGDCAFYGANLHRALVARGLTVDEFARLARLHPASVYNALNGRRVRDRTAIRIFEVLEKRSPMAVAL